MAVKPPRNNDSRLVLPAWLAAIIATMRRRPARPVAEVMAASSARYRRQLLAGSYAEIAAQVRELWPLADGPNPPAPRLTEHLRILDARSGRPSPAGVLSAADLLVIADRRSRI